MPKFKSKLTREQQLKKKREAERERYHKIKNDPAAYEEQKEKERQKYLKKKMKGVVKPVAKMTAREKRNKRKQWKNNSRTYRRRIKESRKQIMDSVPSTNVDDNIQPSIQIHSNSTCSSFSTPSANQNSNTLTTQKLSGRKRVRRDRSALFRKYKKMEEQVKVLNKRIEKYKKRYQRLNEKTKKKLEDMTPKSKTEYYLKNSNKFSQVIRKKLMFGEVLSAELTSSYKTLKSDKTKQLYHKILSGKILKKYKLLAASKTFLKYKRYVSNKRRDSLSLNYERLKRKNCVSGHIQRSVRMFLEDDENSVMCPGKKDCITKGKQKKQKRYLSDSLKNLYEKYIKNHKYISYPTFCRLRPFWVIQAKADDRNTCLCVKHENMDLIIKQLHRMNVINAKNIKFLLMELCCATDNEKCLFRKCKKCADNVISYNEFDGNAEITYQKWSAVKHEYKDKKTGKTKFTSKTSKENINSSVKKAVEEFQNNLNEFLLHEGRKLHQYRSLKELKKTLQPNEVIIHIDYSENYSFKYGREIQSYHFGGSRQQVTLHTVVAYYKQDPNELLKTESFCTLSESLHHGPAAVSSHLYPVITDLITRFPLINTLHIYSDSPSNQYRNKAIFAYISSDLPDAFPNVEYITWNYSECGHGKGAPDGVGGVLKRTADKAVAQGMDIADFSSFVEIVKKNCKAVKIIVVEKNEINMNIVKFEKNGGIQFKGTMRVHQVCFHKFFPALQFRYMSCFDCQGPKRCKHFHLGEVKLPRQNELKRTESAKNSGKVQREGIKKTEVSLGDHSMAQSSLQVGDWVLVHYDDQLYPGEVLNILPGEVEVKAMAHTDVPGRFKWPKDVDIHRYPIEDIERILMTKPEPCDSRAVHYFFPNETF